MKGFSVITSPLTKLLRKGVKFEWTDKCHNIFEQLKEMLVEAPILMNLPREKSTPYIVMLQELVWVVC